MTNLESYDQEECDESHTEETEDHQEEGAVEGSGGEELLEDQGGHE